MSSSSVLRCLSVLSAVCTLTWQSASTATAADWPSRVQAHFEVSFSGLKVGTFDFVSTSQGATYDLSGMGKLSLLLGAFKWSGETRAQGRVVGAAIKPQSFTFAYRGSSKAGSTRLSYTEDTVSSVLHDPPAKVKEGVVPVLPAHLKAVFDPMSAVLALSKGGTGNPCTRRIPVYDGKARFDLLLTPRGIAPLTEQRPSGQPAEGYVCRVRYVPISGHKADQETKYMSSSDGIEVVLRPIPSANIFVPYRISIPTIAGTATIVSKSVEITTANRQQIALLH
jgi:hypothetical protein